MIISGMPHLCEDCREKQKRMFSRDSRRIKKCDRCKEEDSTREHENYCDECSIEFGICRGCGK